MAREVTWKMPLQMRGGTRVRRRRYKAELTMIIMDGPSSKIANMPGERMDGMVTTYMARLSGNEIEMADQKPFKRLLKRI
jgi:hypothetical protein